MVKKRGPVSWLLKTWQVALFTISNGGIFGFDVDAHFECRKPACWACTTFKSVRWSLTAKIVIRPMMYLALSYDHRLIDGREAVQFLVAIKGMLEDPARILLEL